MEKNKLKNIVFLLVLPRNKSGVVLTSLFYLVKNDVEKFLSILTTFHYKT